MKIYTPFNGDDYSFNIVKENCGEVVKRHLHSNWDETWYITKGEYKIIIDKEVHFLTEGDYITALRGSTHSVTCMKDGSERIAIFRKDVEIYYVNAD